MKLIMTLVVRDEEDIIKENIDFHLSQGVDFFIVINNLSTDSTSEILKEYQKKGFLHYIYEENDKFNQAEWVTRMARMAYTRYGADWIINNDADEFWWPQNHDTLKDFFKTVPNVFNIVECERHNFVPVEYVDPFYQQMIYRESTSLNYLGKPLPSKVAHRGNPNVIVHAGNHKVSGFSDPTFLQRGVEIFHFPIRTYSQFMNKIKSGGASVEDNKQLAKKNNNIFTKLFKRLGLRGDRFRHHPKQYITWRKLYKRYKEDGDLLDYFEQHSYDQDRIINDIENGKIVKDSRLKNYFARLYKNN